ncbi:MAG: hypothetical protein M3Y54_08335 [Bacteroidota bacterium]|nr:hypothetical protein [Bacteroidota bacterium]
MQLLQTFSIIPIGTAAAVGAWRFRELDRPLRGVAVVVFCELLIEVLSRVAAQVSDSNLFLLPIDTVLEFGLLAWVYAQVLRPSRVSRWLPLVIVLFSLWGLLSYLRPGTLYEYNTSQRFAESLMVLSLVVLYFYKVIRDLVIVHLEREPMFWVSMGLLIYFAGNLFIFISSNYVVQHSTELSLQLWVVHAGFYIILNLLYTLALWIAPSNRK